MSIPAYPLYLSILTRDNHVRTMRLRNATVKDAGETAKELSRTHHLFVTIHDSENVNQGYFLEGIYVDSSTSEDDIIEMAEAWQANTSQPSPTALTT